MVVMMAEKEKRKGLVRDCLASDLGVSRWGAENAERRQSMHCLDRGLRRRGARQDRRHLPCAERAKGCRAGALARPSLRCDTGRTRSPSPLRAGSALPLAQLGPRLYSVLSYALEHRPHFANVLEDGRLPLDNNLPERTIRPFTVDRKNWDFCDSLAGAGASVAIYSLLCTYQENGIDARGWFACALDGLLNVGRFINGVLDSFLPW